MGWTSHVDEKTGATYYWNAELKTSSWTMPEETATATYTKMVSSAETGPWVKHSDPETGMPYFVHSVTNESQWDVPSDGFVDATVFGSSLPQQTTTDNYQDYTVQATFNSRTGQFGSADATTYWEATGRPNDKDGRMMHHFFDVNTLEQNRIDAVEKQKKLKKYDWRKYKEMKKDEKRKRRVQALLRD